MQESAGLMNHVKETVTFAGCPVPSDLFTVWERHWAPRAQPFFVNDALARRLPPWPRFTRWEFHASGVPLSLHDTFTTYNVVKDATWVVWVTCEAFYNLGYAKRFDLLQEQRIFGRAGVVHADEVANQVDLARLEALMTNDTFVWWPQLWARLQRAEKRRVLGAFVETERLPCRRDELAVRDWERIATCLPGARALAGSFLPESGGNCLGTVMAAFGAPAVAERWVHPEPFERWLGRFSRLSERSARASAESPDPGQILVWRDEQARVQHAAVGLGAGFVLHKEAQAWYAPRQVMRLEDALTRWQESGRVSVYEPRS